MNTIAIVQARLGGASRFGGQKVLADIRGRAMISRVMERLGRAKTISEIVVVVPLDPSEDELYDFCVEKGWKCDRLQTKLLPSGAYDVLGAYAAAAFRYRANPIVRVTADCPLLDHGVVDAVVQLYLHKGVDGRGVDYVSNNLERTFPHGFDVECFGKGALKDADLLATDDKDREHVTEYIRRHQDRPYTLANVRFPLETASRIHAAILVSARLTVDYPEDLELVRAIYAAFPDDHYITTADIVALLADHPELLAINEARAVEHWSKLDGRHEPIAAETLAMMRREGMGLVQ